MIYKNKARAMEVAAELNARRGYAPSFACLTSDGWTVICSNQGRNYLLGRFGVIAIA